MRASMYLRQKTNLGGVEYQALSCCNVEGGPALALYPLQIWWPRPPKLSAGFLHPISNTPWNIKKPQTHHHAQWTISVINRGSEITGKTFTAWTQEQDPPQKCREQDLYQNAENRIHIMNKFNNHRKFRNHWGMLTARKQEQWSISQMPREKGYISESGEQDLLQKCREQDPNYRNSIHAGSISAHLLKTHDLNIN